MLACCLGPDAGFPMVSEQHTAVQPLRYKMKVEVGDYASLGRGWKTGPAFQVWLPHFLVSRLAAWWGESNLSTNGITVDI